tara:strand:- start:206 stop:499 length:294 start_codon:yes stop_codon:yes gene_type:complete
MNLLYFVLCSYGLTQILVCAKIFEKIRPSHHFFHCSMCVGFHVGWFLWAINRYTELFTFDYSIATAFVLACISSGTSYMLNMIFGDEGINFKIWGDD